MLSPYTKFPNLDTALIILNLHVARVKFVREGFVCKKCLTFDTRRLLAVTQLHTDP